MSLYLKVPWIVLARPPLGAQRSQSSKMAAVLILAVGAFLPDWGIVVGRWRVGVWGRAGPPRGCFLHQRDF